jgi:glycosyltransferase involved in cell wall biosynthesis
MQENHIKVSIIMPVYNSGKYLKTAVESILSQSLKEIELILVDDGSTDGSSEKCDEYAAKDSRVVVIHEKNGGICAARNAALAIARGEYIGFSDHDDETVQGAYEQAYTFAKVHDLDMVKYGHSEIMTRGTEVLKDRVFKYEETIYNGEESGVHYLQMLKDMAMDCVWDGLFRKSFLDKNDLKLDTNFKAGGEDIDFCGRLIGCKPKLGLMSEVFYHHFIRVGFSTSSKFNPLNVELAMTFPHRLNSYLASYNEEEIYKKDPILYTYTIVRRCIGPVLYNTTNSACDWKAAKIRKILKQIRKDTSINPIFYNVSKLSMLKFSKKYGLIYSLFIMGLYGLCLEVYRMRKK